MNDFELMLEKCEEVIRRDHDGAIPQFWLSIKNMATAARILYDFPKMEKVVSSNVDRIGYDPQNKNADSVGSYFSRTFRSKYESKKCAKVGMMGF